MGLFSADDPRDTATAWLFVIVQFAFLAAIVWLPPGDAWPVPSWLDAIGFGLEIVGVVTLVAAGVNLGRSLTALPIPVPHGQLREGGLYRWVRHPIYTAIMALVVGATLRSASPAVAVAAAGLIGWFMVKARWEETQLIRRYPDYPSYAARAPRFVPFWPVRPPAGRGRPLWFSSRRFGERR